MRFTSFGLRFQTALSMTLVATSLGCSACTDEHAHDPAAAPQMPAAARVAANAELRGRCTMGLVPPADAYAAVTEIPPLGDGLVFMQDINDDGVAVGSAQVAGGGYHAFRHTDLGGVQDLGALSGFGAQSYATAIAPDGAIGGHSGSRRRHRHAVRLPLYAERRPDRDLPRRLLRLGSERRWAGGRPLAGA